MNTRNDRLYLWCFTKWLNSETTRSKGSRRKVTKSTVG